MLTELGLKLIEVGGGSGGATPAGGTTGTPGAKAAAATEDSPAAPAGMAASLVTDEDKDSMDSFRWDGDENGVTFDEVVKPKASVSSYPSSTSTPSCCRASVEAGPTCSVTQSVDDIVLPPILVQLLLKAIPTTCSDTSSRFVVANTGATGHMVPDRGAFISYTSIQGLRIRMGNNSFAPVLGRGTAIISLNSQCLLIRNVLHVPGLRVPLYSLRAHLRQSGCRFLGSYDTGMHVYFPGVVLTVDTSSDCHLSYESLGKSASLSLLHYVQPRCLPMVYPTERSAHLARTRAQSRRDHLIAVSSPMVPEVPTPPSPVSDPSFTQVPQLSGKSLLTSVSPALLPTLTRDDITRLIHHKGSFLPPVRPCDRANGSDTKTHWTLEDLHRALLGCRHFRNYKHILQTSLDSQWIDGGEFPLALGSYATIPKANSDGAIDRTGSRFLDIIHMDIVFGDCILVGGFCYALVLVDRATRYNWVYDLKDLSADSILLALRNFKADAGSYAHCFRSDCDPKLFGKRIPDHLIDNNSNVVAAPAGCQSANSLVESHWKTMVHMSRAYLTEKQIASLLLGFLHRPFGTYDERHPRDIAQKVGFSFSIGTRSWPRRAHLVSPVFSLLLSS
jgi:hypothetical protein